MSKQKPYVFTERFVLNSGEAISLSYCKVGGSVYDKPYSIEDAVLDYTVDVFKQCNVKVDEVKSIDEYKAIGPAISQYALLEKTAFSSVLDHRLDDVRSLLGEVRRRMI